MSEIIDPSKSENMQVDTLLVDKTNESALPSSADKMKIDEATKSEPNQDTTKGQTSINEKTNESTISDNLTTLNDTTLPTTQRVIINKVANQEITNATSTSSESLENTSMSTSNINDLNRISLETISIQSQDTKITEQPIITEENKESIPKSNTEIENNTEGNKIEKEAGKKMEEKNIQHENSLKFEEVKSNETEKGGEANSLNAAKAMEKIEKEFYELKEKFISEKIQSLQSELASITSGSHQQFVIKCKELEESRNQKIWASEKWKEYQIFHIESIFQNEKNIVDEEFKQDKKIVKEKLISSTIEKKRKLQEDKNSISISNYDQYGFHFSSSINIINNNSTSDNFSKSSNSVTTRTLRSTKKPSSQDDVSDSIVTAAITTTAVSGTINNVNMNSSTIGEFGNSMENSNYTSYSSYMKESPNGNPPTLGKDLAQSLGPPFKKRINPPNINYTLKDNEILDDISVIQKAPPLISSVMYSVKSVVSNSTNGKSSQMNSEVYADKGKLYYHKDIFEKGMEISIEVKQPTNNAEISSNNGGGTWRGVIVSVNPAEIQIRSNDGNKSRFSLAQLRSGKYSISSVDM